MTYSFSVRLCSCTDVFTAKEWAYCNIYQTQEMLHHCNVVHWFLWQQSLHLEIYKISTHCLFNFHNSHIPGGLHWLCEHHCHNELMFNNNIIAYIALLLIQALRGNLSDDSGLRSHDYSGHWDMCTLHMLISQLWAHHASVHPHEFYM